MSTTKIKYAAYRDGKLLDYCTTVYPGVYNPESKRMWYADEPDEWHEIKPFHAVLTYAGYNHGRSAFNVILEDSDGCPYQVAYPTFDKWMKTGKMNGNTIEGDWIIVKRGSNFRLEEHKGEK